jgi:hypothetical protein
MYTYEYVILTVLKYRLISILFALNLLYDIVPACVDRLVNGKQATTLQFKVDQELRTVIYPGLPASWYVSMITCAAVNTLVILALETITLNEIYGEMLSRCSLHFHQ